MTDVNWSATLHLPKTTFDMRGHLPQKEPTYLASWTDMNLEGQRRAARTGAKTFTLHDGPPYANGHLHLGHAVNKIAKDIINRFWWMQGYDTTFQPGWDCHGLPIEAKVEEAFKDAGTQKRDVDPLAFRKACRDFAQKWIDIQRAEFGRMGLSGPFDHPYTTMDKASEAAIVQSFLHLVEKGLVYQGLKPVLWSPVEETALAEAEVEYKEVTSKAVFVGFPFDDQVPDHLKGADVLIWTTTPWTLPANRAVAYGDIDYVLCRVKAAGNAQHLSGKTFVVAKSCLERVQAAAGLEDIDVITTLSGNDLKGINVRHPLYRQGFNLTVPLLPGDHVSDDAGTGLVHTAPDHGLEDFALGKAHDLPLADLLMPNGTYKPGVPLFAGQHIYKVADAVIAALKAEGTLWAQENLRHSYPHSWRSKTPLIYRATPQWFLNLDGTPNLRKEALQALKGVTFLPHSGRNRLTAMIETRPDWCLSRQRAWGVPLMLFVHKETGELLVNASVNTALVEQVNEKGCDVWWELDADVFLGPFGLSGYQKTSDIVDVWFESGLTQSFVLDERTFPADLYLEGSDQHRGWFQSSLVLSTALRGRAPFKTLLTHGFVVDGQGQKMSKSGGNNQTPLEIINTKGADLLRLWVASSNIYEDLKMSDLALKNVEDTYRRLRNTFRFVLGNLHGATQVPTFPTEAPLLERWMLAQLHHTHEQVKQALASYQLNEAVSLIHRFCNTDLSSFYFDIRKDALYCDAAQTPTRQAAIFVLWHVLRFLMAWIAPLLPFTAEDVFQTAKKDLKNLTAEWPDSVHLVDMPFPDDVWANALLLEDMVKLRTVRSYVTAGIEKIREKQGAGTSLELHPRLYTADPDLFTLCTRMGEEALATFMMTSAISLTNHAPVDGDTKSTLYTAHAAPHVWLDIHRAEGDKCARCWRWMTLNAQQICARCAAVVDGAAALSS
jgi:isoleucyl-tRNA synthetase